MTGKYSTSFGYEFTPIPALGRTVLGWLAEEDDFDRMIMGLPELPEADFGLPQQEQELGLSHLDYSSCDFHEVCFSAGQGQANEE